MPESPKTKRSRFPASFWVANTMEIFERMAWYGFFTVSSLYITGAVAEGGLGFTSEQRGTLQGIITFILYLLPVLAGSLADRFGYKKTFFLAYAILVPSYFLLGQFKTYETFFLAFLMVAIGAAIFKPVVTGTVAKVTDDSNSHLGFAIFYMMVNVGSLFGPLIAGVIRGWSWHYVFVASSLWIAVNFFWLLIFYKEPTTEASSAQRRTVKKVLSDMVEVIGNVRFFFTVFVVLVVLMIASKGWLNWTQASIGALLWVILNLILDVPLRKIRVISSRQIPDTAGMTARENIDFRSDAGRIKGSFRPRRGALPLVRNLTPMKLGNWRFALYLLILSGFWTSFNQIFITMPEYIRDFVDTSDMLGSLGGFFAFISPIHPENIARILGEHIPSVGAMLSSAQLNELTQALYSGRIRVEPWQIEQLIEGTLVMGQAVTPDQLHGMAEQLIRMGHQVNPEYLIKFDAFSIVCFQLLVSTIIARWRPFNAMVGGILMASLGLTLAALMHQGWPVVSSIVVFAFGEMMASPKSQEYIGRIAPGDKKALYMGYYFWAVALGNLFGGVLSGQFYGWLARDLQRPDLMWISFGVLGLITAVALVLYDRLIIRKMEAGKEMV